MSFFKRFTGKSSRVEQVYDFGKVLGKGTFSTVRACQHKKDKTSWAVKIIDKKAVGSKQEMLEAEVSLFVCVLRVD